MKRACPCPLLVAAAAALILFFSFSATPAEATINFPDINYPRLQDAIDAASASGGDLIVVAPGTYRETITMRDGVDLLGQETARTFLDGSGGGPVVTVSGAVIGSISSFTFINASVGILVSDNTTETGAFAITNNVFEVGPAGTGVELQIAGNPANLTTILNNTFYNNGTAISRDADLPISSNIFANSQTMAISDSSTLDALTAYNDFFANVATGLTGTNPVFGDPLFVDPVHHDFHLRENSPCIDTGDPTLGLDFIDLTPVDIGAYGGQFADSFPFPVSGLSVAATTPTSIKLSWLPNLSYLVTNTTNPGSYNLYYGYASGDYGGTDAIGGSAPISVGTNTTFTLSPSAPILDQPVPGDSQLVLSWSAIAGATGYKVHYGIISTDENTADVQNVTSYRLTGLTNGQLYNVAVSAYSVATYYLSVTAVDSTAAANESALAPELSVQLSQPLESGLSNIQIDFPDASAGYPPLKGTSNGCFIATAAYGSYSAPEVLALRAFRDRYLLTTAPGRLFVRAYYRYSPAAAALLNAHPAFKPAVRATLIPAVGAAIVLTETSLLFKLAVLLLAGCVVVFVLLSKRWGMVRR